MNSNDHIALTERYSAHNYSPLGVVISEGDGIWVKDVEGKRYLDMLSSYSALNFGHKNKRVTEAALDQLTRLTLTSRAFYNDQLGPFCKELAELCGMEMVLPMNSGAEAVETAIKTARRWGYKVKGIERESAEIIVFKDNFHGRTTTIVGFSTEEGCREGYGPFTPGFKIAEYGDIADVERLITKNTVGILFEPIQGEAGVLIPPDGFISHLRKLATERKLLLIADEIQTGLCRTGRIFACDHEGVKPDIYIIGKSLGGGVVPISAVVGMADTLSVFTPGSHGSTFGGNPFACRIAREVLAIIREEHPEVSAEKVGKYLLTQLRSRVGSKVEEVRGRGLFIGIDIKAEYGPAKKFCEKLKDEGMLCKDTRKQTIRLAPPLMITNSDIDWALERLVKVLG